jgi:hypothetical protein
MKDESVWYGYLQAGDKSSPVARNEQLDTSNPKTMYLFNLSRQEFVEYSREIVEPKLRALKADEKDVAKQLEAAYKKARKSFKAKGELMLAKAAAATPAKPKKEALEETIDVADTDEDVFDDDVFDEE